MNTGTNSSSELTKKLIEWKNKYKDLESETTKTIQKLKEENRKLMKNSILGGASSDKHKEVLRLSAFGYAPGNIHNILTTEKGMQITLEEVELIVDKIELMPRELYKFYLDCKQDFKDKVSIDSGFFKSAIYKKYMLLESTASSGLARAKEAGADDLILKYTDQLVKLYEKMSNTFFKNGVDMSMDKSVEDLMEKYETNKENALGNIIKLDMTKLKVL